MSSTKRIITDRFGEISYNEEDILFFPRGIPAFENMHSWVLAGDEDNAVKWLQSVEDGNLALPVTSPDAVQSDYNARIPDDELKLVGSLLDTSDPAHPEIATLSIAVISNRTKNFFIIICLPFETY